MWRRAGTATVPAPALPLPTEPCLPLRAPPDTQEGAGASFHTWHATVRQAEARREFWTWSLSFLFCTTIGTATLAAGLWQPAPTAVPPPVPEPAAIALDLVAPESSVPTHAETVTAPEDRKPIPEAERVKPLAPALPVAEADAPDALRRSVQTPHVKAKKRQKPRVMPARLPQPSPDPATADEAMDGHQPSVSAPLGQVNGGLHGTSGSDDPGSWQARLLGRLASFRRYPAQAQADQEEGTAFVRFTMDRKGHVLDVAIAQTSGSALLDRETLALVRRAEPLPEPPESVAGDPVTLTVPVEFYLRVRP